MTGCEVVKNNCANNRDSNRARSFTSFEDDKRGVAKATG
jgi:hypothetical protein